MIAQGMNRIPRRNTGVRQCGGRARAIPGIAKSKSFAEFLYVLVADLHQCDPRIGRHQRIVVTPRAPERRNCALGRLAAMPDRADRRAPNRDIGITDERREIENRGVGHVRELHQRLEGRLSHNWLRIPQIVAPVGFGPAGDKGRAILSRRVRGAEQGDREANVWRKEPHGGEYRPLTVGSTFVIMIAFAHPPRRPNRWFVAEPPLAEIARRPHLLRRLAVPTAFVSVFVMAVVLLAQMPSSRVSDLAGFARNRNGPTTAGMLRRSLGVNPTLSSVRALMGSAFVFCRPAEGRQIDSLLVCLGTAVRFDAVYSRMAFRFVSRGDSVTAIVVCPALILSPGEAPIQELKHRAHPTLSDPSCWHEPDNPAYAEWTYAALPAPGTFTTVTQPDAPRMQVESAPTPDTLLVIW